MTVLYDTKHYVVEDAAGRSIIGEDGAYTKSHDGYCVINKESGNIEHSTTMLPGAIFQAQHFSDTLESLLNPTPIEDTDALASLNVGDDIVPN